MFQRIFYAKEGSKFLDPAWTIIHWFVLEHPTHWSPSVQNPDPISYQAIIPPR
jgi:hypothetical protein